MKTSRVKNALTISAVSLTVGLLSSGSVFGQGYGTTSTPDTPFGNPGMLDFCVAVPIGGDGDGDGGDGPMAMVRAAGRSAGRVQVKNVRTSMVKSFDKKVKPANLKPGIADPAKMGGYEYFVISVPARCSDGDGNVRKALVPRAEDGGKELADVVWVNEQELKQTVVKHSSGDATAKTRLPVKGAPGALGGVSDACVYQDGRCHYPDGRELNIKGSAAQMPTVALTDQGISAPSPVSTSLREYHVALPLTTYPRHTNEAITGVSLTMEPPSRPFTVGDPQGGMDMTMSEGSDSSEEPAEEQLPPCDGLMSFVDSIQRGDVAKEMYPAPVVEKDSKRAMAVSKPGGGGGSGGFGGGGIFPMGPGDSCPICPTE